MSMENLKFNKCPQCRKDLKEVDLEYINDVELKTKVVRHKLCGFEVVEEFYKMALEQGQKESEAREAINKVNLTPVIFKMFVERYLAVNGNWKLKGIGLGQIVQNNKGEASDYFLVIPFKGKMPKVKKRSAVNQGKGRGFTKPLKGKRTN